MLGFNTNVNNTFSAEMLALAKEHSAHQKKSALFSTKLTSNCEEERAAADEMWREMRNSCEFFKKPSEAWQTATGLRMFTEEDWEAWVLYSRQGIGRNPFDIPQVPSYNLSSMAFNFNTATNTMNIGIGSKIQMDGYFLEVLENSVVARSADGSFSEKGASSATALNSLLRGLGVDASWGYDTHSKQAVMSFLEKIGVDTSQPFFINGTQFEVQDDKLRTVGETAQQELQFWGFEGLSRLVAQAYAKNLVGFSQPSIYGMNNPFHEHIRDEYKEMKNHAD